MKMQIAYLPGGKWMLVLSEAVVDPDYLARQPYRVFGECAEAAGGIGVTVSDQPVELEGEIAYSPEPSPVAEAKATPILPLPDRTFDDAEIQAKFGEFKQTDLQPFIEQQEQLTRDLAAAAGVDPDLLRSIPVAERKAWYPDAEPRIVYGGIRRYNPDGPKVRAQDANLTGEDHG